MISFNDTLNTVSGFSHFLAPFTNIAKGAAMNSFIFNNTGVFFVKIGRPLEFIIKVLVIGLIITSSFFTYGNFIITGFDNTGIT